MGEGEDEWTQHITQFGIVVANLVLTFFSFFLLATFRNIYHVARPRREKDQNRQFHLAGWMLATKPAFSPAQPCVGHGVGRK